RREEKRREEKRREEKRREEKRREEKRREDFNVCRKIQGVNCSCLGLEPQVNFFRSGIDFTSSGQRWLDLASLSGCMNSDNRRTLKNSTGQHFLKKRECAASIISPFGPHALQITFLKMWGILTFCGIRGMQKILAFYGIKHE
ncbi:hypothetical protein AMECASPLE_037149, partial [Ameca splendens]